MKIIDIITDWKEYFEDFGIEGEVTEESFMEHFELNGEIMMKNEFEVSYGMGSTDVSANFYCGPSIGDGYVSDGVRISEYLHKICDELDIKCDIDVAENYHILMGGVSNYEISKRDYNRIKKRISQDFKIDIGDLDEFPY